MNLEKIIKRMQKAGDTPLFISGFVAGATWANEQNAQEIAELVEALRESALQIKYLQYKFQETGSGNAVLANILALLKKYE